MKRDAAVGSRPKSSGRGDGASRCAIRSRAYEAAKRTRRERPPSPTSNARGREKAEAEAARAAAVLAQQAAQAETDKARLRGWRQPTRCG